MKRLTLALGIVLIASLLVGPAALAGNGAPSGAHYNLNIIGVSNDKNPDMYDTSGHTLFVPLQGKCNIGLTQGDDFRVMDRNCTDDKGSTTGGDTFLGAEFVLPAPDPGLDGTLDYSVFVRVTGGGKNNGTAYMTTCYYDPDLDATYCATGQTLTLNRQNYSKFENVSQELLTVCAYSGGTWRIRPLFDDTNAEYFWEYDNYGLKKASLRFYPNVETDYSLNSPCVAGSPRPDR